MRAHLTFDRPKTLGLGRSRRGDSTGGGFERKVAQKNIAATIEDSGQKCKKHTRKVKRDGGVKDPLSNSSNDVTSSNLSSIPTNHLLCQSFLPISLHCLLALFCISICYFIIIIIIIQFSFNNNFSKKPTIHSTCFMDPCVNIFSNFWSSPILRKWCTKR